MPSGHFSANGAWLAAAVLAHNLVRWTQIIGDPTTTITTAGVFRNRLIAIPARLVNRARRPTLRLPTNWPWADQFLRILATLRTLPQLC